MSQSTTSRPSRRAAVNGNVQIAASSSPASRFRKDLDPKEPERMSRQIYSENGKLYFFDDAFEKDAQVLT
jgi:hypothetical protein